MSKNYLNSNTMPRWYVAYIAMAVFTVVVLVGGIFFSHVTVVRFAASVERSSAWERVFASLDRLHSLGAATNAPGNNIFRSLDINKESGALSVAVDNYQRQSAFFRSYLLEMDVSSNPQIMDKLYAMDDVVSSMLLSSKEIFSLFESKEKDKAARKMAELDEQNLHLSQYRNELQESLRIIAHEQLEKEQQFVLVLQWYEHLFTLLFVIVLGFSILYGYRSSQQFLVGSENKSIQREKQKAAS